MHRNVGSDLMKELLSQLLSIKEIKAALKLPSDNSTSNHAYCFLCIKYLHSTIQESISQRQSLTELRMPSLLLDIFLLFHLQLLCRANALWCFFENFGNKDAKTYCVCGWGTKSNLTWSFEGNIHLFALLSPISHLSVCWEQKYLTKSISRSRKQWCVCSLLLPVFALLWN